MNAPTPPEPGNSPRQVVLGLFILGQLVFLAGANGLGFLEEWRVWLTPSTSRLVSRFAPDWPEKQGHAWEHSELLVKRLRFYSQLTGQDQAWSLFAPSVSKVTGFPAVLLSWDDDLSTPVALQLLAANDPWQAATLLQVLPLEKIDLVPADLLQTSEHFNQLAATPPDPANLKRSPETGRPIPIVLLSDNEPRDREHFFRWGRFRLRRIESQLVLNKMPADDQQPEEIAEEWSKAIEDHVREYGGLMQGYLRWRLEEWMQLNPSLPPPRQMILLDRAFRIRPPDAEGNALQGPFTLPLARWQPHAKWDDAHGSLERFNPVLQRFQPTSK